MSPTTRKDIDIITPPPTAIPLPRDNHLKLFKLPL